MDVVCAWLKERGASILKEMCRHWLPLSCECHPSISPQLWPSQGQDAGRMVSCEAHYVVYVPCANSKYPCLAAARWEHRGEAEKSYQPLVWGKENIGWPLEWGSLICRQAGCYTPTRWKVSPWFSHQVSSLHCCKCPIDWKTLILLKSSCFGHLVLPTPCETYLETLTKQSFEQDLGSGVLPHISVHLEVKIRGERSSLSPLCFSLPTKWPWSWTRIQLRYVCLFHTLCI